MLARKYPALLSVHSQEQSEMRQSHAQTGDQLRTMLLFAQGAIHLMSFTTSEVGGWVGQGEEEEPEGRVEEPQKSPRGGQVQQNIWISE